MRSISSKLALAALVLIATCGLAAAGPGIVSSDHDLRAKQNVGETNTQVCIFCHTPHKAAQQGLIWNHNLSLANYSFGAAGPFGAPGAATTHAGTPLPASTAAFGNGPTKLCMSCHDGSVALGALNNIGEGVTGTIGTTPPNLGGDPHQIASATGGMGGNHPVAIPFPDIAGASYNGITTGVTSGFGGAAGSGGWASQADVATAGLELSGGPAAGSFGVECTSCHDPHNDEVATTEGEAGKYFLRASADNSTLCLSCHRK